MFTNIISYTISAHLHLYLQPKHTNKMLLSHKHSRQHFTLSHFLTQNITKRIRNLNCVKVSAALLVRRTKKPYHMSGPQKGLRGWIFYIVHLHSGLSKSFQLSQTQKKYSVLNTNEIALQHTVHVYLPNQHHMKKDLIWHYWFKYEKRKMLLSRVLAQGLIKWVSNNNGCPQIFKGKESARKNI